jgi:hypothetical protein
VAAGFEPHLPALDAADRHVELVGDIGEGHAALDQLQRERARRDRDGFHRSDDPFRLRQA